MNDGNGHQLWTFEPLSLKGQEVHDTLVASAALSQDFKNYLPGGLFVQTLTFRVMECVLIEAILFSGGDRSQVSASPAGYLDQDMG